MVKSKASTTDRTALSKIIVQKSVDRSPGIFLGKRNIISCYIGGKIVATSFLKKDDKECKISTLFVNRGYRGNGIGAELLEKCFCWLDTSKPLITIADYKACQLSTQESMYSTAITSPRASHAGCPFFMLRILDQLKSNADNSKLRLLLGAIEFVKCGHEVILSCGFVS